MTMNNWVQSYQTWLAEQPLRPRTRAAYLQSVLQFKNYFQSIGIQQWVQIDQWTLQHWQRQQTTSPTTQRRQLLQLGHFFTYAQRQRWLQTNPVSKMQLPTAQSKSVSPLAGEQIQQVLNQLSITDWQQLRTRLMIELLYTTGMRAQELAQVKLTDLKPALQVVQLPQRIVLYDDLTAATLQAYLTTRTAEQVYLFESRSHQPLTRQAIWQRVKQAGAHAGVDNFAPAQLRASFAARLTENGAPPTLIQTLLGAN